MKPEEEWAGEFGDSYHERNWVDWTQRIPFWHQIISMTNARSVLELGCGPGWNLSAIHRTYPDVVVGGIEINPLARGIAIDAGLDGVDDELRGLEAELVFTVGCLIHIPPDQIEATMKSLVNASYKYVLCVEYEHTSEIEIPYRGQSGLLWKRPYRQMYEDLGLKEIAYGKVGKKDGFDDCIWGVMSK